MIVTVNTRSSRADPKDGSATKRCSLNEKDAESLSGVDCPDPDPDTVSVGSHLALGFPEDVAAEGYAPVFAVLSFETEPTRR
jgi:hypothetical protein